MFSNSNMNKVLVLIPGFNPDQKLVKLATELSFSFVDKIIIVNDGSSEESNLIFEELKRVSKVILLDHDVNKGKGAALKTGFEYIYSNFDSNTSVVTADADGQHSFQSIINVADSTIKNQNSLVLGVRSFSKDIPFRSRFGNILTQKIFKTLFGISITDTQTGLRGISHETLPLFMSISCNRYEYETEMLLVSKKNNLKFIEVPIETIYENNNESSHFNPLLDSMRIYFVLFRYTSASLLSAIVDYIVFIGVFPILNNILLSTYTSRLVSLFVNYFLVRNSVFYSKNKIISTFPKYLLLVIISGFLSATLIYCFHNYVGISILLSKIIAETGLYFMNFAIQKKYIFKTEINQ